MAQGLRVEQAEEIKTYDKENTMNGAERLNRNAYQIEGSVAINAEHAALRTKIREGWKAEMGKYRGSAYVDSWACTYPAGGKISVSPAATRKAFLGSGDLIEVVSGTLSDANDCIDCGFPDAGGHTYQIGFKFAEYPSEISPLSARASAVALYRYSKYKESAGILLTPDSVAKVGDDIILTMTAAMRAVEGLATWVAATSRKCIVWLTNPIHPTLATAVYHTTIYPDGAALKVNLGTSALGQGNTNHTTTAAAYQVLVLGPTISCTAHGGVDMTDPTAGDLYFFVGTYDGTAHTFDYSGQIVLPALKTLGLDLTQITKDAFGDAYTLDGDGAANLTQSVLSDAYGAHYGRRVLESMAYFYDVLDTDYVARLIPGKGFDEADLKTKLETNDLLDLTLDFELLLNAVCAFMYGYETCFADPADIGHLKTYSDIIDEDSIDSHTIVLDPGKTLYVGLKWDSAEEDANGNLVRNKYVLFGSETFPTVPHVLLCTAVTHADHINSITYEPLGRIFGGISLGAIAHGLHGTSKQILENLPLESSGIGDSTKWVHTYVGGAWNNSAACARDNNWIYIPISIPVRSVNGAIDTSLNTTLIDVSVYVDVEDAADGLTLEFSLIESNPTTVTGVTPDSTTWDGTSTPKLLASDKATAIRDYTGWITLTPAETVLDPSKNYGIYITKLGVDNDCHVIAAKMTKNIKEVL